ncbi:MAG TPA: calcium-binding protein, partial [Gammaproteobacteria bacterium]|nr:calcium-binding protein [Gammaproteobacteria bacterium]
DVITDFTAGSGGDLLDFRPLFNELGYSGADPFGEGWLQLEQSGADLKVNLDRNGGGDSFSDTMVTLQNVTAADFITQNALPAGPLTNDPVTWTGTTASERYVSGGGDDTLDGGDGDDEILSGAGADIVEGGRGNDLIYGGAGNDVITDEALTSTSGQKLYGEDGDDQITGGGQIYGGEGNDTIKVTATGDSLYSGRVDGGNGADTITVDGGQTGSVYGGDGDDILNLYSRVVYEINSGSGDDQVTLEGNWDRYDSLYLGTGNDQLDISLWQGNTSQSAYFRGDDGDDVMLGRDVTKTNNSYDYLEGGNGNDTITGGDADENISGGNDDDILSGNYGDDIISGGQGTDTITGGDGADTITGGDGADTLTGGLGQDIFVYSSRYDYGDVITDFTAGSGGDLLDFRPLFTALGYSGADPFGDGWLQLEQSGVDLKVNLDRNGGGDSFNDTMATLKNVLASDFTTQNALPAGPLTPIAPSTLILTVAGAITTTV